MMAWTVSWRAQSRCSSTARETQLIGCPPAWITRSRPVIYRVDPRQLCGLVVDEQERRVLRGEEMVGERVAHRCTGHRSEAFRTRDRVRPKLVAITVSGCHLVPVICGVV